jgi:hypothetical protein
MKINAETLGEAVFEFLATLDDAKKSELRELIPNPREGKARKWMEEVIDLFGLDQQSCKLKHDIERRFADESVFRGDVFDNGHGIFEAEIVLRQAKMALLANGRFENI